MLLDFTGLLPRCFPGHYPGGLVLGVTSQTAIRIPSEELSLRPILAKPTYSHVSVAVSSTRLRFDVRTQDVQRGWRLEVDTMNGRITVFSLGGGSLFEVHLPNYSGEHLPNAPQPLVRGSTLWEHLTEA